MEKIVSIIVNGILIVVMFGILFSTIAVEIASSIMRWIDENRSR